MSKWTGWGLLIWFLLCPDALKNGIQKGVELGGGVLVPSIFPYLVISGILVKTGALQGISKHIRIGNLSQPAREMLIPSLFCGYPTGARLASMAYQNNSISKGEFRLLFVFSNIPGFGFSVAYLGSLFGNSFDGVLSYLSFLFASVTLLWFFGRKLPQTILRKEIKETKERNERNERKEIKNMKLSEALVESVSESAQTMVSLLFFVCFFSSLIDLLGGLSLPEACFPIGAAFLEITTGTVLLKEWYPMEVIVFFCGFSGLSVLFQSLYFDKKYAVNFPALFLGRVVYGIVSVCYFMLLRLLFGLV